MKFQDKKGLCCGQQQELILLQVPKALIVSTFLFDFTWKPSVQQYLYLMLLGNNASNMRGGYNLFSVSKRIVNNTETGVLAMEVVHKKSCLVPIYFATK